MPSLRVSLLNTLSLVKHAVELADFIVEANLDLLAITETWLHDAASHAAQLATPPGYKILRGDRSSSIGGGVALIFRDTLDIHLVSSPVIDNCEHIVLKLRINHNVSISLLVLYRPPYKMTTFEEQLLSVILDILKPASHLVVLGDFNYSYSNHSDSAAMSLISALESLGLSQKISVPTHRENNILDWVLCYNISTDPISVLPCPWSDHFHIVFSLLIPEIPARLNNNPRVIRKSRNLRKVTPLAFASVALPLLNNLSLSDDVDVLTAQFRSITESTINVLAPEKERVFKTEAVKKTWFSSDIIKSRQTKRLAERRWRKDPSQANKDNYSVAARRYKESILQAKEEELNSKIEGAKSNSKALFSILRELEGKVKHSGSQVKDSSWCQNIQDALFHKVNTLRETIKIRQGALPAEDESLTTHLTFSCPTFHFKEISVADTLKIINQMKPTTCKGDPCPADIIKGSAELLAPLITRIINASFASSHVPASLKQAWITPLLKKDGLDPAVAGNYRPITNVPFLLKILDRVAYLQIQEFLEQHCLLGTRQSGFRARHGTESALLDLKNNLVKIVEGNGIALLMLLDLSAAFDLVDHSTLISRLSDSTNFSSEAAGWVASFLSGRSARVFSGDSSALPTTLACGVPQGSCVSPTLYNVYTKPLFDALDDLGVGYTNYADDTQVFITLSGNYQQDSSEIERIFAIIQSWMARNFLALNDGKTELLMVGTRQRLAKLGPEYGLFSLAGTPISVSSSVKTLGVYLDSNLSMKRHVSYLHSSCAYLTKLLFQIRPYLSEKNLSLLACALVNAKLDYCNGLLAGTSVANISSLQRIQNGAVRAVVGLKRNDHVSVARNSLHWLPVQSRIIYKTLLLTYKCQNRLAPAYLADCLTRTPHRRVLRSNQDCLLAIPRYRLEGFGGTSFCVCAPLEWNKLPLTIRCSPSLSGFKKCLKTYLFRDLG